MADLTDRFADAYAQWQEELAERAQDPEWVEWASFMRASLHSFFTEVVPDMPDDPWGEEGLRHAEQAALRLYPDIRSAEPSATPQNFATSDPMHRYLGEVFIRRLDGRWVNLDADDGHGPDPAVGLPYTAEATSVRVLLNQAADQRTGDVWLTEYRRHVEQHGAWVAAGRPGYLDWVRVHGDPIAGLTPEDVGAGDDAEDTGGGMTQDEREYAELQRHYAELEADPVWQEWLAGMEAGLDRFFAEVVPDMPADRFGLEGVRHAEAAALRIFPDMDAANPRTSPQDAGTIDAFHRYLGEVFVRNFEGRWRYADVSDTYGRLPVVELPYDLEPVTLLTLLTSVVGRRTGEELSTTFGYQQETYGQWVEAGRPAYPAWAEIEFAKLFG
ncbi:hypothetical protein DT076_06150 [Desertihabitans brevis]|uniref:Uncharacterized protein n=1 Tax=Desertihabitans brevis TaxID=2268447 RepID=A0A367YWG6_9ACTN|nr:hypothetical protein [Desertihabitans brevis]RCK70245.1 hypothetical protein DT076_06150 [Desertihabitans brevis]